MQDPSESLPTRIADLLEARLRRLEYVVFGQASRNISISATATSRLKDLEIAFTQTIAASRVRQDLLNLYTRSPNLFDNPSEAASLSTESSPKLPVILAAASAYPRTASSLTSILDMPLPPAESSRKVIEIQPQVAQLELLQESNAKEIAQLKQRSATVLQRWYTVDILTTGEYWADVEQSIEDVEQSIRRLALSRQQDGEVI